MTDCPHDWSPVPLESRRYRCARCGCLGYRGGRDILPLKRPREDELRRQRAHAFDWWRTRLATARVVQRGLSGADYAGDSPRE